MLAIAALGVLDAARPAARPAGPGVSLSYLGASVHPPGGLAMPGDVLRFGSLSGLAFDAASGHWVAAIDDVSRPRLAWLDIIAARSTVGAPAALPLPPRGPGVTRPTRRRR